MFVYNIYNYSSNILSTFCRSAAYERGHVTLKIPDCKFENVFKILYQNMWANFFIKTNSFYFTFTYFMLMTSLCEVFPV